ncbi:murein L,D-transpeptidase [Bdellovibrio bacteriovorus]|uniref:L,D-transpeptidase family protein n=1 Tax=Bdellovibrio TaxID=958 RepID=UPI0035A94482
MYKHGVLAILALTVSLGTVTPRAQAQTSSSVKANADVQEYLNALDTLQISSVRDSLMSLWSHGLNPSVYWTADFERAYSEGTLENSTTRREVLNAYYKALRDVAIGGTTPQNIASDIKIKRKEFFSVEQMRSLVLASGGRADLVLEQVAPQVPLYRSLREALQRLYPLLLKGGWDRISPVNKELSMGVRHPVIVKLKGRLQVLGYKISVVDDVFDQDMLAAINDVQTNLRMKADGKISPKGRTWGFFWVFCGERVRQIQADMEKIRWLPQQLEDRHIFVNTAFAHFVLTDKAQGKVMSFKAINGTSERKTPTMRDKVTYLVLNPTWTVPPTVFLNDKVEIIKNLDSNGIRKYFADNNFEVYTSDFSRKIDPTTINWRGISSSNVNFYIRQKPNYMNALGVVKFMMTNPYAIYLHDTNQRELFSEAQRLRSSGCVRLEKPLDLAEYLLEGTSWSRTQIESFTVKPSQVVEQETVVNLKNPIPVYLIPVTSQMNSDGVIRFVEDAYGHNQLILNQIRGLGR